MSETRQWTPLRSPIELNSLPRWKRFLWGISCAGTNKQMWQSLLGQMQSRTSECLQLWKIYTTEEQEIAERISRVVCDSLKWPNPFFLPQDPFRILMWDYTGDLGTEETISAIEKHLGLPWMEIERWEEMLDYDFGRVVKTLVAHMGQGHP